jgi:hypothetical protein
MFVLDQIETHVDAIPRVTDQVSGDSRAGTKNCVVYLEVQTVHLVVRTPGSERPDYEISHNQNLARSLQE